MKIQLRGLNQLSIEEEKAISQKPPVEQSALNVTHCAVCRTDAKMWNEGHRDLMLPVVPGHEVVAVRDDIRYVIWPGNVCGTCKYCKTGRENLCETMQIIGFHRDGGFASEILVPEYNLIKVPEEIPSAVATFAEPLGCVINALNKAKPGENERILIYGAGTLGIITALYAADMGAIPTIIEHDAVKLAKGKAVDKGGTLNIVKNTDQSYFDYVINACPDVSAFGEGITKLAKGGTLVFFSGLTKNKKLESNLINLVHYRELKLIGAYGLKKADMQCAITFIRNHYKRLNALIEDLVAPHEVEELLPAVLSGDYYKFIIDFNLSKDHKINKKYFRAETINQNQKLKKKDTTMKYDQITPISNDLTKAAWKKLDMKTKPQGSLGKLEEISVQMCGIQKSLNPKVNHKASFVFTADHGIAEEGVSAFPQEVTKQMVTNFLNHGAAINVLCDHNDIDISIIDIGIQGEVENPGTLLEEKINHGTQNFALTQAMSGEEAEKALKAGAAVFRKKNRMQKIDLIGLGEMGIANTSSATAIISAATGVSVAECTDRGSGVDDQGLQHKQEIIEKALALHKPDPQDGLDILCKVGGFEIAGMAGAALEASANECAVVLDGLISTAAGIIAYLINPNVADYFISGHKSVEQGHIAALEMLNLKPMLDLDFRLGEGTGAALTMNLVEAACKITCNMASLEEAGVSASNV